MDEIINYDDSSMNEEFITAREYEDATKTVVRTLGREAECQVIFSGKSAKIGTDKNAKIVVLPANDPKQRMTKRQYFIGQGFANHETLHSVCTDIQGLKDELKSMKDNKQYLTFSLANAIEDVRIENAGAALYPGIPRKLDATAEFAAQSFLESNNGKDEKIVKDFKKIGPLAITWAGRKKMGYNAPSIDKCLALIPKEIRERAEKYADEVLNLPTGARGIGDIDREESFRGSHMSVEMARRISEEEKKEPKKKEKPDDGEPEGKSTSGKVPSPESEPIDADFLAPLVKELTGEQTGYFPLFTGLDVWVKASDKTAIANRFFRNPDNYTNYKGVMDSMNGKLAVMKRKLERTLQAKMERERTSGHRAGSLDVSKKGVSIMRGRQNVFRRREDGKDVDAAVTLLVDASGSMNRNGKMKLAQQSCIALAEAIGRTGVPLEILVFTTRMPNTDEVSNFHDVYDCFQKSRGQHHLETGKVASREEPITMIEIKSFDHNMNQARSGLGGLKDMVCDQNADGESVLKAWDRLKKRPEERKIMMVLSDGGPHCDGNTDEQHYYLQQVIKDISKEGCECIGVGILSEDVKKYYPKHSIVHRLTDLSGTVLDNIARLLLGERFVIDNSKLEKAA